MTAMVILEALVAGSTATRLPLPLMVRGVLTMSLIVERRGLESESSESGSEKVLVEM